MYCVNPLMEEDELDVMVFRAASALASGQALTGLSNCCDQSVEPEQATKSSVRSKTLRNGQDERDCDGRMTEWQRQEDPELECDEHKLPCAVLCRAVLCSPALSRYFRLK
ncbi:hypothetical protein PHSY_004455 [Pseudozyma hubeiensis SY62]|uniref:Uncharacterized protein n=1 Tax=Pseudozyma hubeiensis (strain SY62) TaxID=1305764 RepID=R9P698_PSEHS|nr:hypothetical protein PHSY_004455 [Pseudozyma hubeiensis SY62]GAC96871.1 hypothetical protein PHSY_004455 [Pseudozyma hubeiensis SY62]